MGKNFLAIKRKYKIAAIVAAIILGACCGAILSCVLAVIFKRCAIEFHWALYIPIAFVTAAACATGFYFLLRPRDKKLAARLDSRYGLGQRTQTMVEYADVAGDMPELQREQAEESLAAVAKKRVDVSYLLKFLFIPVIAAAMLFVGIFVPAKKQAVEEPAKPDFSLTEAQRIAILNLIEDVNGSELTDGVKTDVSGSLSSLLTFLETAEWKSDVKTQAVSSIQSIDGYIAVANSYVPLYNATKESSYISSLGIAIAKGVTSYKEYYADITDMSVVEEKISTVEEDLTARLTAWQTTFKDSYYTGSSDSLTILSDEQMTALSASYKIAFDAALEKAAEGTSFSDEDGNYTDELFAAVSKLGDDLTGIGSFSGEDYVTNATGCAKTFSSGAMSALHTQAYACLMDEYVRNSVASVLGLKYSDFGSNESVAPTVTEEDDTDGDKNNAGGGGNGNVNYGTDALVYDPESGEQVQYTELLYKYSGRISETIAKYNDILTDEDSTEEEKAEAKYVKGELSRYVYAYLDLLAKGTTDSGD